mmetsp:Transcript_11924/g.27024  ORF Transcript_11924/g.27024 Transcript_11924/m.27024 type:complete len:200 (-) Transcript_11924:82-681(-)
MGFLRTVVSLSSLLLVASGESEVLAADVVEPEGAALADSSTEDVHKAVEQMKKELLAIVEGLKECSHKSVDGLLESLPKTSGPLEELTLLNDTVSQLGPELEKCKMGLMETGAERSDAEEDAEEKVDAAMKSRILTLKAELVEVGTKLAECKSTTVNELLSAMPTVSGPSEALQVLERELPKYKEQLQACPGERVSALA